MAIAGAICIGLCVGWIVAPAATTGRAALVLGAGAGTLAVSVETALIAGESLGFACAVAAGTAAGMHAAWRRRLRRTVSQ